jgi:hypothetical protein
VQLEQAFGTVEPAFAELLLNQLIEAIRTSGEPITETTINGALAAVQGIGPRDETDAMLAAQMVATHSLAMSLTRAASTSTLQPHIEAGHRAVETLDPQRPSGGHLQPFSPHVCAAKDEETQPVVKKGWMQTHIPYHNEAIAMPQTQGRIHPTK